ncbi:MAG TPA: hypothetical protein VEX86_06145 [Longimicrobium sp.]|nr:hypothetical protein [Longimicrobium sp.]
MSRIRTLDWRAVAFAAVMAASLGFGAKEAFAAGTADRGTTERACSSICRPECGSFGGSYIAGRCYCCG